MFSVIVAALAEKNRNYAPRQPRSYYKSVASMTVTLVLSSHVTSSRRQNIKTKRYMILKTLLLNAITYLAFNINYTPPVTLTNFPCYAAILTL